MKDETRILELLAELLQKQDRMQEGMTSLQQDMQEVKIRLGHVEENQRSHHKILKTLVVAQQNTQQVLERIFDLLDTITRMQRDHGRRLDRLENPDGPGIAA